MSTKSLRGRLPEATNIWPGFVDILATLLIVIIFILMIFTVSQIYLSDAITGRDKALEDLRKKIVELNKSLLFETDLKKQAISELEFTQQDLESELIKKQELQKEITQKRSAILAQDEQISSLGIQISKLLEDLKIIANALEFYEDSDFKKLETKELGERINKALAFRIEQLNQLNSQLTISKHPLALKKVN